MNLHYSISPSAFCFKPKTTLIFTQKHAVVNVNRWIDKKFMNYKTQKIKPTLRYMNVTKLI